MTDTPLKVLRQPTPRFKAWRRPTSPFKAQRRPRHPPSQSLEMTSITSTQSSETTETPFQKPGDNRHILLIKAQRWSAYPNSKPGDDWHPFSKPWDNQHPFQSPKTIDTPFQSLETTDTSSFSKTTYDLHTPCSKLEHDRYPLLKAHRWLASPFSKARDDHHPFSKLGDNQHNLLKA